MYAVLLRFHQRRIILTKGYFLHTHARISTLFSGLQSLLLPSPKSNHTLGLDCAMCSFSTFPLSHYNNLVLSRHDRRRSVFFFALFIYLRNF